MELRVWEVWTSLIALNDWWVTWFFRSWLKIDECRKFNEKQHGLNQVKLVFRQKLKSLLMKSLFSKKITKSALPLRCQRDENIHPTKKRLFGGLTSSSLELCQLSPWHPWLYMHEKLVHLVEIKNWRTTKVLKPKVRETFSSENSRLKIW